MKKIIVVGVLLLVFVGIGILIQSRTAQKSSKTNAMTEQKEGTFTLKVGTSKQINDMTVTLRGVIVPQSKNCYDCAVSAQLDVEKEGKKEAFNFFSGGITGKSQREVEKFGYLFTADTIEKDSVLMTFSKQK